MIELTPIPLNGFIAGCIIWADLWTVDNDCMVMPFPLPLDRETLYNVVADYADTARDFCRAGGHSCVSVEKNVNRKSRHGRLNTKT